MKPKSKILIIAGLDGDYLRKPFGHILECIPLCDNVVKLKSMCTVCKDGILGIFSNIFNEIVVYSEVHKRNKSVQKESQVTCPIQKTYTPKEKCNDLDSQVDDDLIVKFNRLLN